MNQLPIIPKKQFTYFCDFLGKRIKLVPFNQGQQSILLEVSSNVTDENVSGQEIINMVREKLEAIKQVVSECIIDGDIDVGSLPIFVIEELYIALRSKSIGEDIELKYRCTNLTNKTRELDDETTEEYEGPCNTVLNLKIDLLQVNAKVPEDMSTTFVVFEEDGKQIGVTMKFMSIDDMISSLDRPNQSPVIPMIESVFDEQSVYKRSDYSDQAIEEFFSSIPIDAMKKIKADFIDKIPTIEYHKELVCPSCGAKHPIHLKGLTDFFQ